MRRPLVRVAAIVICLCVQLAFLPTVRAEDIDTPTRVAAVVSSSISTAIGLPLKLVTCGAVITLGGVGYGLTLGQSDFVQQEVLAGTPYACGAQLKTIPPQVSGPQPREMDW